MSKKLKLTTTRKGYLGELLVIQELLKRNPDLFRTYFYRECRKRRVFLEDKYANLNSIQVKQVTEQLLQEGQDTLIIGDDIDL